MRKVHLKLTLQRILSSQLFLFPQWFIVFLIVYFDRSKD